MNALTVRNLISTHGRYVVLGVLLQGVLASAASAGTLSTWRGANGTSNNWNAANNWTSPAPSLTGTFSLVYSGTPTRTTSFNNIGNVRVDAINFTNDGTTGKTSSFTISGSSLTLVSGANVTTTAASVGTLTDTISSGLSLAGSANFSLGTNHNLTVGGPISQASGSVVKSGAGTLLFTNASTSLSGLDIQNGVVGFNANSVGAISSKTVTVGSVGNTGTLRVNGFTGSSSANVSMNGNALVQVTGNGNVTFTNANFNASSSLATPATLTLSGGGLGNLGTQTVQGAIRDNAAPVSVTVSNLNLWVLQGANTYTGATTVEAGSRLMVNGSVSASSTTTSDGLLAGSGTFGGAVVVNSGTLAPGGSASTGGVYNDSIGTLTVGSLQLGSGATTAITISGSSPGEYDQIVGTGSLAYGGTLSLTMNTTSSYADYTSFSLFSGFTSTSGSFSAITLDAVGTAYAGLTFTRDLSGQWKTDWVSNQQLRFSESSGTLTVVPEPSTVVFAGIGAAMCGWSTWKRRRATLRRRRLA